MNLRLKRPLGGERAGLSYRVARQGPLGNLSSWTAKLVGKCTRLIREI